MAALQDLPNLPNIVRGQESQSGIEKRRPFAVHQINRHGKMAQHVHAFGDLSDLIDNHFPLRVLL